MIVPGEAPILIQASLTAVKWTFHGMSGSILLQDLIHANIPFSREEGSLSAVAV